MQKKCVNFGSAVILMAVAAVLPAKATTYYVATNGNNSAAGTNWPTAKQTIQAAVDLTTSGDTVLEIRDAPSVL